MSSNVSYTSMEMQDQLAHILIGDKGTFLDLGSADPYIGNNTASLESFGWTGLAFDSIDRLANAMNQSSRRTNCYPVDVTVDQPFLSILHRQHPTKHFNYISLDVDEAGVACLKLLIENGYTFDVMTFEHDAYLEGDARRTPAREILTTAGYRMLFKDVKTCSKNFSPVGPTCRPNCTHDDSEKWEWEDWWVGPSLFEVTDGLFAMSTSHQDCIKMLREHVAKG
jgi:hypothetical protein